jgi:hypothetical protein
MRTQLESFKTYHYGFVNPLVCALLGELEEVNARDTQVLLGSLNRVTNDRCGGRMPSFELAGARSGYIEKRFAKRASYLGLLLLQDTCADISRHLLAQESLRVASVGGAAGSDYVGLLTWLRFLRGEIRDQNISCSVYDYEVGWKQAVDKLANQFQLQVSAEFPCLSFHSCNVLNSIKERECNSHLCDNVGNYNLFCFNYVLVENTKGLEASNYSFFADLFCDAKEGAVFVFMDSSFKLFHKLQMLAHQAWGENHFLCITPKHRDLGNNLVLQRIRYLEDLVPEIS